MNTNITVGRIVAFHPNGGFILPNGMPKAAAIVTQTFEGMDNVNMQLFLADASGTKPINTFSVPFIDNLPKDEKGNVVSGTSYWDWLPKV